MAETFITNQGIEYLYKLPNSKIDEEEGAEYGLILSRNQIENVRYNSDIISFLTQLPNLRVITEQDFVEKTKNLLIEFFESHPINALEMNSHWIKKFLKKNYQILKHIDPVFDTLVNKDSKFCSISSYLLFSILGSGDNNNNNSNSESDTNVNTESNYTLYRKIKDPNSGGKTKKVLHSVCTFNFCNKELVVGAVCANKQMYFNGAGMLLNILMDMGIYLKLPSIRLRSITNINSMSFYIKNSLIPVSFRSISKIVDEHEQIPMVGDIDIRVRPNWKLNSIVDKHLVNLKAGSYVRAFTLSKSPDSEEAINDKLPEEPIHVPISENDNKLYEKYTRILNFIKTTIVGIKDIFSNEENIVEKEKPPIFTNEVIELFKDKILEVKAKNKELAQKHNEKIREMKEEYKTKVNKPIVQNIGEKKPIQARPPPQPKPSPPALPAAPPLTKPAAPLLPPPLSPLDEVELPVQPPRPPRPPRPARAERPPRNAKVPAKVTKTNKKKNYSPKNKTPKKI